MDAQGDCGVACVRAMLNMMGHPKTENSALFYAARRKLCNAAHADRKKRSATEPMPMVVTERNLVGRQGVHDGCL